MAALTLLCLGGLAACQLIVTTDVVQCRSEQECLNRGPAFAGSVCVNSVCVTKPQPEAGADVVDAAPVDPKWGCVGNVVWPPPSATENVTYRQRLTRINGTTVLPGVSAKVCEQLDLNCTAPLQQVVSDEKGDVVVTVPKGFRGNLQFLTPPSSFPLMYPAIAPMMPPPYTDADLAKENLSNRDTRQLASSDEVNVILGAIKATQDPELGNILILATDCSGEGSAGITLQPSVRGPSTIAYYMDANATPSITQQETSVTGLAGFVNMPPGSVNIDLFVPSIAKKVGSIVVIVRKGTNTLINLGPSPL